MPVALDDKELTFLRTKLKNGEYDGLDIMHAWLAIDELIELRKGQTMIETTQPAAANSAEPVVMRQRGDPVPMRVDPGAVRVYGAFAERDYGDCLLVRVDLYSHYAALEEIQNGGVEEGPIIVLSTDTHTLRLDETQPRGADTMIEFHEHRGWRVFASSWTDCETLALVLVSPDANSLNVKEQT